MMNDWEHLVLNLINVITPIISSFVLGAILTAKLFNMEVSFVLYDYILMFLCVWGIFMFQAGRFKELQKWSKKLNRKKAVGA